MSSAPNHGRLVQIETAFHREATKPGGVDRSSAQRSVRAVLKDSSRVIEKRLDEAMAELFLGLASIVQPGSAALEQLQASSNDVRDMAGLVDRHLLTETATALSDVLDAIVYEGKHMQPVEAQVYVNALRLAQHDDHRGTSLTDYSELLSQLKDLTTYLINRPSAA